MARYRDAVCRICRKAGDKLFLKGTRCTAGKCALDRREYASGEHGQSKRRPKFSDYGLQLREKQKLKSIYGLLERQFKVCFKRAEKTKGITGEVFLQLLERRLDRVIFRLCFGKSMDEARQLVNHGHVLVNKRKVDIPSFSVKAGDVIEVKAKENIQKLIRENIELVKERGIPVWIEVDHKNLNGKILKLPERTDVQFPVKEQLIVEYYSK